MSELIINAFTGVNLIPTLLLILLLFYWITVIVGAIDFDLIDLDGGAENIESIQAILSFLKIKEIPVIVTLSVLALHFWILSMLIHLLEVEQGGLINGILLIPALIIGGVLTKITLMPLRKLFIMVKEDEINQGEAIIGQIVIVISTATEDRLGQAEIKRDGAPLLINVKPDDENVSFHKGEEGYVVGKDKEKNIYYIIKIKE